MIAQEIKKTTIIVNFLNFKEKIHDSKYLESKKTTEGKIFVTKDVLEVAPSIRKDLLQKSKDLRLQNKLAQIVYNILVFYKKDTRNDISESPRGSLNSPQVKSKKLWLPHN